MVGVAIIGVLAALTSVSMVRGRAQSQLDSYTNKLNSLIVTGRNRAVATRTTWLLDVRAKRAQLCQIDPTANPVQSTCPTPPVNTCNNQLCENIRPVVAGAGTTGDAGYEAVVIGALAGIEFRASPPAPAPPPLPGGKQLIYFFRDGTADRLTGASPLQHLPPSLQTGVTLYLRGESPSAQGKHRKILVFPASGRPRILDNW
jgi:hypothetical protein